MKRHKKTASERTHRAQQQPKSPGGPESTKRNWPKAERPDPDATRAEPALDEVDEALMESFPGSDPPAYGTGHS